MYIPLREEESECADTVGRGKKRGNLETGWYHILVIFVILTT